jgi:hypothetical protein
MIRCSECDYLLDEEAFTDPIPDSDRNVCNNCIAKIIDDEEEDMSSKKTSAPKTNKEQRYVLRGDDSGHKYFIPVGQESLFEEWVTSFDSFDVSSNDEYAGPDFESNRIDGHFTFTDPRCE